MGSVRGFFSESATYGLSSVLTRLFSVILIPLYTTHLNKSDYSNLLLLQSFVSLMAFATILSSGVFYYYYRQESLANRKALITSWLFYGLTISTFFIVLIILFHKSVLVFFIQEVSRPSLESSLIMSGVLLIPTFLSTHSINIFRIERRVRGVLFYSLTESVLIFVLIISFIDDFENTILFVLTSQLIARSFTWICSIWFVKHLISFRFFSLSVLRKMIVYSWPFLIISTLTWFKNYLDQFIGVQLLADKEDVGYLVLAAQISIPIVLISEMIRMAIGPFVMSSQNDKTILDTRQMILDMTSFTSFLLSLLIIAVGPQIILLLSNESFLDSMKVLPFLLFSGVILSSTTQLVMSFSLQNKNTYLIPSYSAGLVFSIGISIVFMPIYGFWIAGLSQLISSIVIALAVYLFGKKIKLEQLSFSSLFIIILLSVLLALSNTIINGFGIDKSALSYLVLNGFCALVFSFYIYFQKANYWRKAFLK